MLHGKFFIALCFIICALSLFQLDVDVVAQYGSSSSSNSSNSVSIPDEDEDEDEESDGLFGFMGDVTQEDVQQVATVAVAVGAPTATVGGILWWVFLKPI